MTSQNAPTTQHKKLPLVSKVIFLISVLSGILYFAFTKNTAFADWFNTHISAVGRRLLAWISCWFPFSGAELLFLLILPIIVLLSVIGWKHFCNSNRDALTYIGILLSGLCVVWILFVWNFAAGYYATTLDEKLGLEREKSSADDLYQTAELLADELRELAPQITFVPSGESVMPYSIDEMNEKLLDAYDKLSAKYAFIDNFYSRVKPIMLSEPLSYTHITGIYTFFTGEANINVNFPDYTTPYTAAHELAHQRGIAREDEANFVAFLVCMESDDPYIRYSACLSVYEYVLSALRSADKNLYSQSYSALPYDVRAEESAYSRFFDKYRKNVAANVSNSINNSYLQSQGEPAGSKSYNMVVDLAVAYYRPQFD